MKKIFFPIIAIALAIVYFVSQHFGKSAGVTPTTIQQTITSTPGATDSSAPTVTGVYKDGTYTGTVANSIYGNVQVAAVIQSGRLTDVKFLRYPNDREHSIEVSNHSLPILKSEAIQSQNARVDTVSGATQTSEAFVQTLASALTQAKI